MKHNKTYILTFLALLVALPSLARDFEYDGLTYTVTDTDDRTCMTKAGTEDLAGNTVEGNLMIPDSVSDGSVYYKVIGIGENGFRGSADLNSISLPSSIEMVGDNAFSGCERLTSLIWRGKRQMQSGIVEAIGNPNLLVYVDDAKFAPQNLDHNIVADEACYNLVLTPGYPFTPVNDFTAIHSSLTKEFIQTTPLDGCAGWETLVLPFDAQSVRVNDARGELTPFPLITDIQSQFPYWIYEADSEGEWELADSIKAGVPYLVAMPNNPDYEVRYNINGYVIFSCEEPTLITASTTSPYAVAWASGREFRSLWLPLDDEQAMDAMGLNVNMYDLTDDEGALLLPGSAFHVDVDPKPLEAYVTRNGSSNAFRISGAQSNVLRIADDNGMKITADGGILYLQSIGDSTIDIFSIDGTVVRKLRLKGGIQYTVNDLFPGIYIVCGQKLIIK